jgi:hypothetical protein
MTLKRPHMSLKTKLDAAIRQLGMEPSEVEWDHNPALGLRLYNEKTGKYEPDANDPRFSTVMSKKAHALKTDGPPATSAGGDKNRIAKVKRLSEATTGGGKKRAAPTKMRSRPFPTNKDQPFKKTMNGKVERRK